MNDDRSFASFVLLPFWNGEERRVRALWRLVGFGVIAGLFARTAQAFHLSGRLEGTDPAVAALVSLTITMGALWLTARLFERRPLSDSGYHRNAAFARELLYGLLTGALLMGGIFAAELALGWVRITGFFRSGDGRPFAVAFLTPVLVFVCVGIYEEAVSRGFLLRTLAEGFTGRFLSPRSALLVATLLQGALFGLGHRNNPNATPVSILNIAVAGLFLALPYLLSTRMAFSIGVHTTWNLFQGNVFGFPVSGITTLQTSVVAVEQKGPVVWTGGNFGPEGGLVCLVAMAVASVLVFFLLRGPDGRTEIRESLVAPPVRPLAPPLVPPTQPDELTA